MSGKFEMGKETNESLGKDFSGHIVTFSFLLCILLN